MSNLEKVIGLPRGLNFYEQYPFLYGFFKFLGIKIVLSDRTTKKTLAMGSALVVSETCLPVKIYVGQVLNLLEKGVKNIFVPSIQSIAPKIYNCSKIRGLPDLIRNVVKEDFNLIEPTLDKSEKDLGLKKFLEDTVKPFGITDKELIHQALKAGFVTYNNFRVMMQQGLSYKKALANAKNAVAPPASQWPSHAARPQRKSSYADHSAGFPSRSARRHTGSGRKAGYLPDGASCQDRGE